MTNLTLPWPPKELSPNARLHWTKVSAAKKAYRAACGWQAKEQGRKPATTDRLHLSLTFYPPTKRADSVGGMVEVVISEEAA